VDETVKAMTTEFEEYLRDESRVVGEAQSISFPKSEEDVLEVVSLMRKSKNPITIQGARTGLAASAVPNGGHIMNMGKMNKILGARFDEKENKFYLRLQPGVLLSQLRKILLNKNFETEGWSNESKSALANFAPGQWFFSPDPTETSASIGGMISCNASGARTFFYGPTRNYISSMRIVLANGSVAELTRGGQKAKGKIFSLDTLDLHRIISNLPDYQMPNVKNASGYFVREDMDLIDFFIGAEGSLGIITEIEVILLPSPKAIWGITSFFPNEKTALRFVRALRGEKVEGADIFNKKPVAIEFFNHYALDLLRKQKEESTAFAGIQELKDSYHTAVYTEFHGDSDQELWEVVAKLGTLIGQLGADENNTWVANNDRDMEKLLSFRHAVPESVNMLIDQRRKSDPTLTKLGTDMAVPDAYLDKVMDMYNSDLALKGLEFVIFGHIGNNHVHVNILPRNAEDYKTGKELYLQWSRQVVDWGGTVSAEHGVGKLKRAFLLEMYKEYGIGQMRELKRLFDPQGMINAGNMFTFN